MLPAVSLHSSGKGEERRREVFIHEIHSLEQTLAVFLKNLMYPLGFYKKKRKVRAREVGIIKSCLCSTSPNTGKQNRGQKGALHRTALTLMVRHT